MGEGGLTRRLADVKTDEVFKSKSISTGHPERSGEILFPYAYRMKAAAQSNLCERGSEAKALSVAMRDLLPFTVMPDIF